MGEGNDSEGSFHGDVLGEVVLFWRHGRDRFAVLGLEYVPCWAVNQIHAFKQSATNNVFFCDWMKFD